jgi:elongation factor 1-gamma
VSSEIHARARDSFAVYAAGINQALMPNRECLVGDAITIADICFVAELCLFFNEKKSVGELKKHGLAARTYRKITDAKETTELQLPLAA